MRHVRSLKHRGQRGLLLTVVMLLVWGLWMPVQAFANVPYPTYTLDGTGHLVFTQTSYTPMDVIAGNQIPGTPGFSSPDDIFIHGNKLYVADTYNSRVVVFNLQGAYLQTIGANILSQPKGIFVDPAGNVYVADSGNQYVYKFSPAGRLLQKFGRPASPLFGAQTPYVPERLVVDSQGNLFIVSQGSVQGLIELSPQGAFEGFFGGNSAGFDPVRFIERLFYTRTQLNQLQAVLPPSPTNVALGPNGLVYTVTQGLQSQIIKRLNFLGTNLLPSSMLVSPNIGGITVDQHGDIFAVDSLTGEIYEYDRDGNLLSAFGGSDVGNQRLGLLKTPSAVAVSSTGQLFVLDKALNDIQVYNPTAFTRLVHQALSLYLDGHYLSSIRPWTQVLRLNSMFDLAHVGIGMAYFKQGNYAKALHQFELAHYKNGYSNAYWELRRRWLMAHAAGVLITIVLLSVLWSITKRLHRRFGFGHRVVNAWRRVKTRKLMAESLHLLRVMRHPVDGFAEIRFDRKTSLWSAHLMFLAVIVVHVVSVYRTNFLFNSAYGQVLNLSVVILQVVIPLLAWVVVNYLVSAINDGEGRLREVYTGTLYALGPYIVYGIPITIMSLGLTFNEAVLYSFSQDGVFLWCGWLMFMMVMQIHGYEIGESFKNIFSTLIGMLILAVLLFILFGLSMQVVDFVHSIGEEVILRVQGQ